MYQTQYTFCLEYSDVDAITYNNVSVPIELEPVLEVGLISISSFFYRLLYDHLGPFQITLASIQAYIISVI